MKVNFSEFQTNKKIEDKTYYTLSGSEAFLDKEGYPVLDKDCDRVYAKKIKNKKDKNLHGSVSDTFYIRLHSKNKLYNPLEKHTVEKQSVSYVDKVCKSENSFMEVNKSVFEMYLEFLKTKRLAWLDSAQRAIS
jgi:hypothetical protein